MSNDLDRFSELSETADSLDWQKALFGDESLLSRRLRSAATEGFKRLATELQALADHAKLPRWLNLPNPVSNSGGGTFNPHQQARDLLSGLAATLDAAVLVRDSDSSSDSSDAAKVIATAIGHFDKVWGTGEKYDCKQRHGIPDISPLAEAFSQLQTTCTPFSYWIVWDLLDRLVEQNRNASGHDKSEARRWSATTPILGAQPGGTGEGLLWLTVELLPQTQGVLCPDPLYLGMTSITDPPANDSGVCFLKAMQQAWDASRLADRFRGRWRIENPPTEYRVVENMQYPAKFTGPSAQAAALCALLAASGDPYGDLPQDVWKDQETWPASEPLEKIVGITACLETQPLPPKAKLTDRAVRPVGSIPQKLSAADRNKLDTLVFAKGQLREANVDRTEVDRLQRQREEAERKYEDFRRVRFEYAGTVAEALDLLLVTNRFLKRFHATTRFQWLEDWERRTARCAGDEAPGPDDDNLPRSEREAQSDDV